MVEKRKMPFSPAGGPKTLLQAVLEKGADLLQPVAPLSDFNIYVTGFHCAKDDPHMQMEAHHYCRQVNEDFIQCILFDGNTDEANLIGIEYIVSKKLFLELPVEERKFWHPHNYEILSGQLIAPGLPAVAEKAMLRLLMNSYGKTFHLWHTGRHDGKGMPGHPLPMGEPALMWSFNRDGEADPALAVNYKAEMEIDPNEKRAQRQDMLELAEPQWGVEAMRAAFPHAGAYPPGVEQAPEEAGTPVSPP